MDRMGDVWMGDPKIVKTPNEVMVASGIVKRPTISGTQVKTELHRCINIVVINESNTRNSHVCTFLGRGRYHLMWK
jgi:hypothetical protein